MKNSDRPMQRDDTTASIMDPHPTVVRSTDLIHSAIRRIMQNRYRHLPVVDDEGRYVGIFGINNLLRLVLPKTAINGLDNEPWIHETLGDLNERLMECQNDPVASCLRTDIAAVYPDTPLIETLVLLYHSKCPVPVVTHGKGELAGMVSYFDVGHHVLDA